MTSLLTIHIFHAFYQLLLWKHVYIAFLKNKVIAQLPWKQVSGNVFSNCAAGVTASYITICFILFVVTSSQSYRNDVIAILTENRHFVTMATGKPLKLLLNSVTSITTSCCHTLVEVIRFFVALSLNFQKTGFGGHFYEENGCLVAMETHELHTHTSKFCSLCCCIQYYSKL